MLVTIIQPNVYNSYGILMPVGSVQSVSADLGASLVRSLRATDTGNVLAATPNAPFSATPPPLIDTTVPVGSSISVINAAIAAIALLGGGTVNLQAGTYVGDVPLAPMSGVSILGVQSQYIGTSFLNAAGVPTGGTILVAGTATTGLAFNATNVPTPGAYAAGTSYNIGQSVVYNTVTYFSLINANLGNTPSISPTAWNPWGKAGLNNVRISGLAFSGFSTAGLQIGAQNNPGCNVCEIDHIVAYNCGWGGQFKNFSGAYFHDLFTNLCPAGQWSFQQSTGATPQAMGNSYFDRIHADLTGLSTNVIANAAAGVVVGTDPAMAAGTNPFDLVRFNNIEVFAFSGRAILSDTGVGLTASSNITVTHAEYFPVGMPVQFTAYGTGSYQGFTLNGPTYFVLTNSASSGASTITLGNSRGGAALAATGISTNATLAAQGMPLLDLGGIQVTNGSLTASSFTGLDLEGPGYANIYLENGSNITLEVLSVTVGVNLTVRNSTGTNVRTANRVNLVTDIDSSASSTQFIGGIDRTTIYNSGHPYGMTYDKLLGQPAFSLTPQYMSLPDIYNNNYGGLTINAPIFFPVSTYTTTSAIGFTNNSYLTNMLGLEPSIAAQVFTLPRLIAAGTASNANPNYMTAGNLGATAGLRLFLINNGSQTCTVVKFATAGTGQGIQNAGTAFSTVTLTAGSSVEIVAMRNNGNTVSYWQVVANNGATFS